MKQLFLAVAISATFLVEQSAACRIETQVQTAQFVVANNQSDPISNVIVLHKYSDVFRDGISLKQPLQSKATSKEKGEVSFRTGCFTTGKDWWQLYWTDSKGRDYVTDPQNLRWFVDLVERLTIESVKALEAATKSFDIGGTAVPVRLVSIIANASLNSETTAGYKQHILRDEDVGDANRIEIGSKQVAFISPSGRSTTVFRQISAAERAVAEKLLTKLREAADKAPAGGLSADAEKEIRDRVRVAIEEYFKGRK